MERFGESHNLIKMDIVIDLAPIYYFLQLPPDKMLLSLFFNVGWIPLALVFLHGAWDVWVDYINDQWGSKQKFILLAIDIPRGNTQSPKAVENIFNYLHGFHGSRNFLETYWIGMYQLSMSLEVVSIDGYTQFLVHTPINFRNLVESAFYSQYPDAEITEVDDYASTAPSKYPDDEYDLFGSELILAKGDPLPIKSYEEFMVNMGKPEEQFKDPMALLMDLCSSLRKGEQLWFQIIITPLGFDWMGMAEKEIKKILKEEVVSKKNIADLIIDGVIGLLQGASELIYSMWSDTGEKKKDEKKDEALKMMNLKPKEKKQIEYLQKKVSKIAYKAKMRFIYFSRKEVMVRPKVVNGFMGYMKQFADLDLNNIKPDTDHTMTSTSYFFKSSRLNDRKMKIIRAYKGRSSSRGRTPNILNVEELATLWHFPVESVVKAPLIQKSLGKKSEPPMYLPLYEASTHQEVFGRGGKRRPADDIFTMEGELKPSQSEVVDEEADAANVKGAPPSNLPFD